MPIEFLKGFTLALVVLLAVRWLAVGLARREIRRRRRFQGLGYPSK